MKAAEMISERTTEEYEKIIHSYLELMNRKNEVESFKIVANVPKRGMGEKRIAYIVENSKDGDCVAFLRKNMRYNQKFGQGFSRKTRTKIEKFLKEIEESQKNPDIEVRKCIRKVKKITNTEKYFNEVEKEKIEKAFEKIVMETTEGETLTQYITRKEK